MGGASKLSPEDLAAGAFLQCLEAATLGMPFEVWKTRMGRFRTEGTIEAFWAVHREGGGFRAFWAGVGAKMVESATKGAVLLFCKENLNKSFTAQGLNQTLSGALAGAGAGVCQVSVMGPCTFVVTAVVTAKKSATQAVQETWAAKGIAGFYPGGTAIAFRQATNWASRQGFTEEVRYRAKMAFHGDANAKLSVPQEALCGIIGGTLACWNHPFEVARVEAQAAAAAGEKSVNMIATMQNVVAKHGIKGLFAGVIPRIGLGIWQTLFMVTGAKLFKQHVMGKPTN